MASYMVKSIANDQLSAIKNQFSGGSKEKQINWDDFNYPPLLNVIHYDIMEVDTEIRLIVRALWLSHILIASYSIINIIDNIIQTALGSQGIRILYSFMFFFSFNPIQCFLFYRGYKGVVQDQFLLTLYKWLQIVMILCWIAFSIFDFLGFNGFMGLSNLFNTSGYGFCGFLALVEDLFLLLTAFLSIYALVRIWQIK